MSNPTNLRLSVSNLGPINTGTVELIPLTILIGPNNSGKSYLAHLVYALCKALAGDLRRPPGSQPSIDDFLDQQLRQAPERVPFNRLPEDRQGILRERLDEYSFSLMSDLNEAIGRYFGVLDNEDLIRGGRGGSPLTVDVQSTNGGNRFFDLLIETGGLRTGYPRLDTDGVEVPLAVDPTLSAMSDDPYPLGLIAHHLWRQTLTANGFPSGRTYYLPAARSGIVTTLEAYTSLAIDRVWRGAGSEPIAIAPFPGVVADFLQTMVTLLFAPDASAMAHAPLQPAIDLLEGRVLKGRIAANSDRARRLAMVYDADGLQIPIHRTSAMVAELAPLALWLKHLLRPGDLLIIDEPEAHLHPENQRLIARVLVRLVRAGVRVICPTHSSLILHQVSNQLILDGIEEAERIAMGFSEDDVLHPDEVGVYLFQPSPDGIRIEPVPIEPDWGIAEAEFLRVAEAIGEETNRLSEAFTAPLAGVR